MPKSEQIIKSIDKKLEKKREREGVYPIPEKVKNELFEFAKHFFELGLKMKGE